MVPAGHGADGGGKSGSVTSIQRFGSALNLNLHFHVIRLDGVFDRGADEALHFFGATPTTEDIEALVVEVGLACERWLGRQGFAGESEDAVEEDDAQGILQLASVSGTVATGARAGRRVKRVTMLGGKEYALGPRCAAYEGYNLHANVSLAATERLSLERLCRYILRPPLAVKRLERLPNGGVRMGMKRIWSDGTSAVEFTVQEFTEKLAALVPPPRANHVLYSGVLAGNAAWRKEVIPKVPTSAEAKAEARLSLKLVKRRGAGVTPGEETPGWAELLKRVFGVDGWECPCCGRRMTLRTIVIGAPASTRVVRGLLRARAPPEGGDGTADRGVAEIRARGRRAELRARGRERGKGAVRGPEFEGRSTPSGVRRPSERGCSAGVCLPPARSSFLSSEADAVASLVVSVWMTREVWALGKEAVGCGSPPARHAA